MSWGAVVVILLAIGLLAGAIAVLRAPHPHPWSAIGLAALASGIAFTVGGESSAGGPSPAVILGSLAGLASVAAAILALVPRSRKRPPSRVPVLLSSVGTVVCAVGLAVVALV